MIILDTNVVSELIKDTPDPAVRAWANRQPRHALLTTSITVAELRSGVEELLQSRRRQELEAGIDWALNDLLGGRVLDFDRRAAFAAAEWYGYCPDAIVLPVGEEHAPAVYRAGDLGQHLVALLLEVVL
jgi:predicted nucleic acid-binding protein